jgi:hypothetical protein
MLIVMKLIKIIAHIWYRGNHPSELRLLGMIWMEMRRNSCPL